MARGVLEMWMGLGYLLGNFLKTLVFGSFRSFLEVLVLEVFNRSKRCIGGFCELLKDLQHLEVQCSVLVQYDCTIITCVYNK